jgi:thioredoxin-dependent peroxiredoxin
MKRLLLAALGVAALSVSVSPVYAQQAMPGQPELKAGDVAPDFTLQATDGKTYTLSQLRGKTVVLAWFPKAFTAG